ncbi:DUF7289 family protein [Haloferacaceae archaeon DSL9]
MSTLDTRGVSETVSFVLVFALVLTSVGIVTVAGFEMLSSARDAEQTRNAERAFGVLAANGNDLYARGAPSRGTELRLADGTLRTGEPIALTITATADSDHPDPERDFAITRSLTPLVYESGDESVRYVGGATLRAGPGGAVVRTDPPMLLEPEHAVAPIFDPSIEANVHATGSRVIHVRTERTFRGSVAASEEPYDEVRIEIATPHPDAWGRAFERLACPEVTVDGETATCTVADVERFNIVLVRFDLAVE